jgi:SAM-dependent methyltransferase
VSSYSSDGDAERLKQQAMRLWSREQALLGELGWRAGMRVLDVGCGTGTTLSLLGGGVGVDRDQSLLQRAKKDCDRSQSLFVRADAARLPFADGSFDLVHTRLVLRHNRRPLPIVEEAVRVSREVVYLSDADDLSWVLEPPPAGWPRLEAALHESARRRGGDPGMGRRLRHLLMEAKLHDVRARVQPISTDDLPAPAWVEMFLAPAARPVDADLLPDVAEAWAEVRAWAQRPDSFGWVLGVGASGRK